MSPQQIQRAKATKRANIARCRVGAGINTYPAPPGTDIESIYQTFRMRPCDLCGRVRCITELRQRMQERGRPIFVLACRGGCKEAA